MISRQYRALAAAPLLAAALAFAGCASIGAISTGATPTVANVQSDAVAACGFLPTAETVAGILATANAAASAGVAGGSAIANLICAAVTKKSAKRGDILPTVNGVVVQGYFVK